jgi:hypothetical protein
MRADTERLSEISKQLGKFELGQEDQFPPPRLGNSYLRDEATFG